MTYLLSVVVFEKSPKLKVLTQMFGSITFAVQLQLTCFNRDQARGRLGRKSRPRARNISP